MYSRIRILSVASSLSLIGAAGMISACDNSWTSYADYLVASGDVVATDGVTPVANLQIDRYDWIVTYKDKSTVAVPFDNFVTGSTAADAGKFAFNSTEIALQSGNLAESCTPVCLGWSTSYEDVCSDWDYSYEDYCSDWGTDEWGDDVCYDWDTTTTSSYCSDWDTVAYDYCSTWGEDCTYYYPSRNIHDITQAYSEITYRTGSTSLTTQSQADTFPGTAVTKTSAKSGDETAVTETWTQNDLFVTPFAASASGAKSKVVLSEKKQAIVAKHNLETYGEHKTKRSGTPKFGRSHPAAKRIKAGFSAEQQLLLDIARSGAKAVSKATK